MQHRIKFYPVGNGDTCQIILDNGKRLLFDFCHSSEGEKKESPLIDLKKELKSELKDAKRNDFDIVAFTHGDDDHLHGSSEFFYLEYAEKYQDNERIKINELWVPAAMILEEGVDGDSRIIRQEARHRLKKGKGIRVFSKPDKLKDWLEENGLSLEERKHLITDAGKIVPGFSLDEDKIEFFVHSPFIEHVDGEEILRNKASLILHATFEVSSQETKFFIIGDTEADILEKIVDITKFKKNTARLEWDVYYIPHHSSYKALNENEKGDKITEPSPKVKELLEYGTSGCILVSSSNVIGNDYNQVQPPHIQAFNRYEKECENNGGNKVFVTMEYPNKQNPEPLTIIIDKFGCSEDKASRAYGIGVVTKTPASRAGNR